ncbi:Structural maintenance of chromosomes protein 3 [Caenorhabditis elegans]|uniref:Isoform a of Structural maintenance of chromosomes protein 3 n=2 Tax=Caenorhabditis elegans TaxID=6239 RepID=B2FDA8-2|nr:Structural maintenance of chromosomes protein 3 [Caenorhabditis elegans]CAB57898.4 Structural maintenance of chromosomes protein 3 [Caenorhabditis elegans]|eukprot:NP_001255118.1 Structural maintenance of chromosomes protein 3 [Caenorhabditis elegans]
MKIKEVRITGFRSYKDNTNVSGFSPRSNVVVGRNGSGKSNFFHAIQFVLSDEYAHLKEEQRLGLLHESTGPKVAHARVEITFDNSEKRLMAFENSEVKIVRQVGKKKDQYYIDNKMVPRAEVVNLMESAGFSRSNPYYIVKQGKINELATSPDAYKLKLLREVAGTRVYDERKEESLKILKETKMKTEKIQGLLKYIDERLQTLENEKEDLKEYQKLDKTKRSVEYTMYDNTNKEAIKEKTKLDEQKVELNQKDNNVKSQLNDVIAEMAKLKTDKKKLESLGRGLREDKETLQAEETKMVEEKMTLKLEIDSLNEENTRERQGRQNAEHSLQGVGDEIFKNEEELDTIKPEYAKLLEEESRLKTDIRIDESRAKEILAKQGQRSQFSSVDDRDKFLRNEIRRISGLIADNKEREETIQKELADVEREDEKLNNEIQSISRTIDENRYEMDTFAAKSTSLKQEYDAAYVAQQTAAREEKAIRDKIGNTEQDISAANDQLRRIVARPVYNGITGVRKVIEEFKHDNRNGQHDDVINGYYGTVIELAEVPDMFRTAVEVIAQNRLFYHVVETDRIATKILRKFNEMQLPGEINFFPMNRVSAPRQRDLSNNSNARPMSDVIDYEVQYDKVFKSITANVIIVRTLDQAARDLRNEGFDVVSVDGDQMSKKGVMTGGFIDKKRSKLELHTQKDRFTKELAELQKSLAEAEKMVRERTQEAEKIRNRMQQHENQIGDFHRKHRELTEAKNAISQQFYMVTSTKEPKKDQLLGIKNHLRELLAQKENFEQEIGSNMSSQLTSDEEQTVKKLRKKVDEMTKQLATVSRRRMDLMHRKNAIENLLTKKLYKTKESLTARVDDISDNERRHKLENANAQLTSLLTRMESTRKQLATAISELQDYETKEKALQINIDNVLEQQRDLEKQQADFQLQYDKITAKEDEVKQKREDSLKKMRLLGALPTDTFSKWQNVKPRELEKKLLECVNELKKYENVNKKALDQYMTASSQKEELTKRMAEQKKSEDSIEELLKVLENRKYEAIDLTFKQVKKNFEQVFKQLVPHGRGKMQMRAREQRDDEEGINSVELYEGISVLVSFVSDDGDSETREMTQLSGGQKSLVALAIIFSIQKCDPAPFYLFDEIDAALDAQHRKSVADMIQSLSDQAQFVTTTFRPELLATAEKFYGVRFRNKVSHIDSVTREQAYDFVEDDTTHG